MDDLFYDTVLVVEDDERIRLELAEALTAGRFRVKTAATLATAKALAFDDCALILLDRCLPDGDAITLCRELRDAGEDVPVILVTAQDATKERVLGLEAGADDYVVKPFDMDELLARVRSVLRRTNGSRVFGKLRNGRLWLDEDTRCAGLEERRLELPRREFDLLAYLMRHQGRPFSREHLLCTVWGKKFTGDVRTVDIHVRRLRAKIERDPAQPKLILTEWGVGYRMQEET